MLFSGRGKHLYTKWPVVSACILEYANRVSPGWKARFNVQHRKDTDFSQGMILFTDIVSKLANNCTARFTITQSFSVVLIVL